MTAVNRPELHAHDPNVFPVKGCPSCDIAMSAMYGGMIVMFTFVGLLVAGVVALLWWWLA